MSRRADRCSDLACGTGGHRIRTQCARLGAAWAGWRGPGPHSHLLAREFQIRAADRSFQPARWTVAPAGVAQRVRIRPQSSHPPRPPPGGPAASAWKWHPAQRGVHVVTTMQTGLRCRGSVCIAGASGVSPGWRRRRRFRGSSCRPDLPAAASGCDVFQACEGCLDGFSRWCPARTSEGG